MTSAASQHPGHTPAQNSPVALSAGPLALFFTGGDLRSCRWGSREVLRRIYGAVRDRHWGTVPGSITGLEIHAEATTFRIRYSCEHRQNEIHFVWQAEISGDDDGTIRFLFDGEAQSTFLRNRIGLCVLHPIRECAGARCRARHSDGTVSDLVFPDDVSVEQPVAGFTDLRELHHEVQPGVWVELAFDGEVFETEDQRNWIDASFKTYSTPLRLPFPLEVRAGTRVRQAVTLRLRRQGAARPTARIVHAAAEAVPIGFTGAGSLRLPEIGLGIPSNGDRLSGMAIERLSRLGLSHLRVDVRLSDARWPERLRAAASDALPLQAALELALHFPAIGPGDLALVVRELDGLETRIARVLIFREGQRSTLPADLEAAQRALGGSGVSIGGGTDADLYQLHLQPPPNAGDFLCWSMNPQVHATDELSIAETPEAVVDQLAAMRRRHPGRGLVVSPITLKPRFNPVACHDEPSAVAGPLPPQVDVRQPSLFTAAWTLAMFKALAEGGARSVTFFETTGWRGIAETATGSPFVARALTTPDCVYPVYHVLRDIGEFRGGMVRCTGTGEWPNLASLFQQSGHRRRLIIANLSAEGRRVSLARLEGIPCLRVLDSATREAAMNHPESFRVRQLRIPGRELDLSGHTVATLDFTDS
jgi:hypothetical protein